MGLLHLLLKRGYEPKELAYIKPCTQCEDVQLVSKYCESKGIAHQGLGPVIFVSLASFLYLVASPQQFVKCATG
jgi:hypothetical protein